MDNATNFRNQFRQRLNEKIAKHDAESKHLAEIGDEYASILEKIRKNIAEVFLQMFDASWENRIAAYNKELKRIAAEASSDADRSHQAFMHYLQTIPNAWQMDLEEARGHHDPDREAKALAKLEAKSEIETVYLALVAQYTEVQS
jgi:hypothetical protein